MSTQAIVTLIGIEATQELKNLLEQKHLYQHVTINVGKILKQQIEAESQPNVKTYLFKWATDELPKLRFVVGYQVQNSLALMLPNVSLFCRKCGRREAFAPLWNANVPSPILEGGKQIALPDGLQIFSLVYQCQRCFGKPEGFLIRREGWSLGLHGRSPMEFIEVPNHVPKVEYWLYRDAVIAFNSGKILAALFYLRAFIEQFARRITGITDRATGDEILDEYYKTLPGPTRDEMPSLREWYDKISETLHLAKDDAALFESAKAQVDKHFDIRRVFNMPEKAEESKAVALPAPHADKR